MVKNKTGGSKHKKRKKGSGVEIERELIFKEDCQEYAQAVRMLGNCKLECQCFDGITRLGHIRGKIKKKARIITGDIILLSLRDFEDNKCDFLARYDEKEIKKLKELGHIPTDMKKTNVAEAGAEDDDERDFGIDFEEEIKEDENIIAAKVEKKNKIKDNK